MTEILDIFVIFLIPFLIGSLVFSSIVAPNTFMSLDEKNAKIHTNFIS